MSLSILFLLIGGILGWLVSMWFTQKRTASGYFSIEPYDDDNTGFYRVNMRIPPSEQAELMNKKRLILYREYSQK